jgi:eukaryotic-like serine/threonine-protein kinase
LNIVHRDVSPQNIMVGADGNSRVLDFGIAQAAIRSRVTASGTVKGKIAYMSPEQLQSQAVDARTDIFAAGIVLWEALTGKRLFYTSDSRETASRLLTSTISPPSSIVPGLPSEVDRVVLKALVRDPEQRFQSAHDFAEALRKATTEGSRRAVSDWVGRVAKDSLARRLDLLESLEASAIHAQASAIHAQASAVLPVVAGSPPVQVPFQADESTGTQAPSTRTILAVTGSRPVARWGPFASAIGGIVAAMVAWAAVAKHPPTQAAPPAPAKTGFAGVPVVDRSAASRRADRVHEVSASAAAFPVESLPLAVPSAEPAKRTLSKPHPIPVVDTHLGPTKTTCTPPYRIDAAGVRRVKLECL